MLRKISIIDKSSIKYRNERFKNIGLGGCDHPYILCINRFPGISQDEISERVIVNKSNTTRTLSRLEEDGYIKRVTNESDKRIFNVELTDKGKEIIPEITTINKELEDYLFSDFTQEEKEQFNYLLDKVYKKAVDYARKDWKKK